MAAVRLVNAQSESRKLQFCLNVIHIRRSQRQRRPTQRQLRYRRLRPTFQAVPDLFELRFLPFEGGVHLLDLP